MASTLEEVAAHEAGHAVVIMAVGVPVVRFVGIVGKHPDSFLDQPFETFAVEPDVVVLRQLEARLTYLCTVGGFAGETTHQQAIEPKGALDDLTRLRNAGLTDTHIQLLTSVAIEIIADNRRLWELVYDAILYSIQRSKNANIDGHLMNARFSQIGKRFTDTEKLDAVLAPDDTPPMT